MQDDIAYLAHKRDGWIISDPKAFKDWFIEKVQDNDEQLRRIVKYMKAWKEYKEIPLKGIEITILVANNFEIYEGRDEKSLRETLANIIDTLNTNFSCVKPVLPGEDLFDGISETKKNKIMDGLTKLKDALDKAIAADDPAVASDYMIDMFGDRFPKGEPVKKVVKLPPPLFEQALLGLCGMMDDLLDLNALVQELEELGFSDISTSEDTIFCKAIICECVINLRGVLPQTFPYE